MVEFLSHEEPLKRFSAGMGDSLIFYVIVTLFLLSLAVYGGLIFLNRAERNARQEIIEQVHSKEETLEPGLLNQIFLLEKRLVILQTLLAQHTFTSNVFKLLERDTHPNVRFTTINLNISSRKIDLAGETTNYATLARQIGILESDPQIEQVEFGGLSLGGKNLLGFRLTILFKQALLQLRP